MDKSLGNNIRNARKAYGYSQQELADRLHITQGAVSQWERNTTRPDTNQLIALSQLLNVSIDDLTQEISITDNINVSDKRPIAKQIVDKLPVLSDEQLYELWGYIAGRFRK